MWDPVVGTRFLSFFCSAAAAKTPLFTSGDEAGQGREWVRYVFLGESEYI